MDYPPQATVQKSKHVSLGAAATKQKRLYNPNLWIKNPLQKAH
jgi:hypothetical protein